MSYETLDSFGTDDLKRLDKIVEILREEAPNIKWNTSWRDYETLDGELTAYVTLQVPLEQYDEALEIYESIFDEEEIDDDNEDEDKYPGI